MTIDAEVSIHIIATPTEERLLFAVNELIALSSPEEVMAIINAAIIRRTQD